MDSVPARKGRDDYVPAVRTESDDCNSGGDRHNSSKSTHPRLHEPCHSCSGSSTPRSSQGEFLYPAVAETAEGADDVAELGGVRHALPSEVLAPQSLRLRGGKPWLAEQVDDLVGQCTLLGRDARRIVPAQASSDVIMNPGIRARDLVGAPMQLPYLLEQRLEDLVIDRHRLRTLLGRRRDRAAAGVAGEIGGRDLPAARPAARRGRGTIADRGVGDNPARL